MALPDITTLTADELNALAVQIATAIQQRQNDAETTKADLRASVGGVIATLDALIGPDTTTKGVNTINQIRNYTQAEMQTNAGVGLAKAFEALDILATTVRDLAKIEAAD